MSISTASIPSNATRATRHPPSARILDPPGIPGAADALSTAHPAHIRLCEAPLASGSRPTATRPGHGGPMGAWLQGSTPCRRWRARPCGRWPRGRKSRGYGGTPEGPRAGGRTGPAAEGCVRDGPRQSANGVAGHRHLRGGPANPIRCLARRPAASLLPRSFAWASLFTLWSRVDVVLTTTESQRLALDLQPRDLNCT
jgi:hypothetical protein